MPDPCRPPPRSEPEPPPKALLRGGPADGRTIDQPSRDTVIVPVLRVKPRYDRDHRGRSRASWFDRSVYVRTAERTEVGETIFAFRGDESPSE